MALLLLLQMDFAVEGVASSWILLRLLFLPPVVVVVVSRVEPFCVHFSVMIVLLHRFACFDPVVFHHSCEWWWDVVVDEEESIRVVVVVVREKQMRMLVWWWLLVVVRAK
jgi:hypothetical protein